MFRSQTHLRRCLASNKGLFFFSPEEFQKHCECEEAVPDTYNQYLNRGGITSVTSMMHSLCDLIILLFVVKASLIHISSLFQELIKRQFKFPAMIMITVLGKCLSDSQSFLFSVPLCYSFLPQSPPPPPFLQQFLSLVQINNS